MGMKKTLAALFCASGLVSSVCAAPLADGDAIAVDFATNNGSAAKFNIIQGGARTIASGSVVKWADGTTVADNVSITHTGGANFVRDAGGDGWTGESADTYYNAEASGDIVYPGSATVFGGLDTNLVYNVRVYALLSGGPATNQITVTGATTKSDNTGRAARWSAATLDAAGLVFSNVVPNGSGEISVSCATFYNAVVIEAVAPSVAAPTGLTTSNVAGTSFDLTWNETAGATQYNLTIATDVAFSNKLSGYDNKTIDAAGDSDPDSTVTENVSGLLYGTSYYYKVSVNTGAGTSPDSAGNVSTTVSPNITTHTFDTEPVTPTTSDWIVVSGVANPNLSRVTVTTWSVFSTWSLPAATTILTNADGTHNNSNNGRGIIESPIFTLSDAAGDKGEVTFKQSGGNTGAYLAAYVVGAGSGGSDLEIKVPNKQNTNNDTVTLDLSSYTGDNVYFRLVDGSTAGWGFVQVDDFTIQGAVDASATATRRAADVEITGYDAIADLDGSYANSPTYADAAAVISYLNSNVTATITASNPPATTPISGWADTDNYDASTPGTYTFTGTLDIGNLPSGYVDDVNTITSVTVEVVVVPALLALANGDVIAVKVGADGVSTYTGYNALLGASASQAVGTVTTWSADGTGIKTASNVGVTAAAGSVNNADTISDWLAAGSLASDGVTDLGKARADTYLTSSVSKGVIYNGTPTVTFSGLDTNLKYNVRVYAFYYNNSAIAGWEYRFDAVGKSTVSSNVATNTVRWDATTLEDAGAVLSNVEPAVDGSLAVSVNAQSGTAILSAVVIEATDGVTPAIGLEVSLEDTKLVWTVEDEVDVKEYRVVNTQTKEVIEVVVAADTDFYSVVVPEGLKVELKVIDNSGFSKSYTPQDGNVKIEIYDLQKGWNLIAVTSDDAELETLKDETVGVLWGWNGTGYEVVEAAKATDAVWVYSPLAKQVYVSGTKSDAKIDLSAGWNMVGPVADDYIPEQVDTVYAWSEIYDIIAGDSKVLIGGKGYWIFSL